MELWTGKEEEVEFLPQRYRIIHAQGYSELVLHHTMLYILHLWLLRQGRPMLRMTSVREGIEETCLQAEMDGEEEREGSPEACTIQVHARVSTIRTLVFLDIRQFETVFHPETVCLRRLFLRWVEERVIREEVVGFAYIICVEYRTQKTEDR